MRNLLSTGSPSSALGKQASPHPIKHIAPWLLPQAVPVQATDGKQVYQQHVRCRASTSAVHPVIILRYKDLFIFIR